MNTKFTKEQLTEWADSIMEAARDDTTFSIAWFPGTKDSPLSIVAGWKKFEPTTELSDLFCASKTEPQYIMCIKIIVNEGPYLYEDFEMMDMPVDKHGEVEDTCIPLEWDDEPDLVADFYEVEWERLMAAYKEEN